MSLVSGVATMGLAMTTGTPALADVDAVSGSATALSIGGTTTAQVSGSASEAAGTDSFGPTGSGTLPSGIACPSGATTPPLGLPLLLSLGLLEACTRGGGVAGENHQGFAESSAAVANVTIAGNTIGLVRSACRADGDGAVGSTQIVGSGVLGLPANPAPNTVVGVPGPLGLINLTLNEQIVTNTPGTADITVRALHLSLLGIEIIAGESRCTATGPDVNVPDGGVTTTTTTAPGPGPGPGGGAPPNNNTNNNQNNNETNNDNTNTSDNENNNTTDNTNTNDNTNTQDQTQTNDQTNDQSQTNSQTQEGGDNVNSNVITITNTGSNFDDFHRRGRFHNDHDGDKHGDKAHGGDHHFGKALARTGSESSRLTGVALLLMIVGAVLVLGTRTVTAEAAAVPGARASRRLRRRR